MQTATLTQVNESQRVCKCLQETPRIKQECKCLHHTHRVFTKEGATTFDPEGNLCRQTERDVTASRQLVAEKQCERMKTRTTVLTDRVCGWHALHTPKRKLCPSRLQTPLCLQSSRNVTRYAFHNAAGVLAVISASKMCSGRFFGRFNNVKH